MPATGEPLGQQIDPKPGILGPQAALELAATILHQASHFDPIQRTGIIHEILRILRLGAGFSVKGIPDHADANPVTMLHTEGREEFLKELNAARFLPLIELMGDLGRAGACLAKPPANLEHGGIGTRVAKLSRVRTDAQVKGLGRNRVQAIAGVEKKLGQDLAKTLGKISTKNVGVC